MIPTAHVATAQSSSVGARPTGGGDGMDPDGTGPTRSPGVVVDVEMSRPLVRIPSRQNGSVHAEAWLVVRIFDEPVSLLRVPFDGEELTVAQIARAVDRDCGSVLAERVTDSHGDPAGVRTGTGCSAGSQPSFLRAQQRWVREGPRMTVVLCTRNRPDDLRRALMSLRAQKYPRFDVLVVDNAPSDTATAELVAALRGQLLEHGIEVSYSVEPRPGLSWARNHALARIDAPVVAWLDDDEVADPYWLSELAGGFCTYPGVAAVSGSVVPARLDTRAQLLFEEYGGHTKGRGFREVAFRGRRPGGQSAVYPLPAYGVGANMAFDVDILRSVGGFDVALGAGTPTFGGEDTLVFSQLLLRNHLIVYRPGAMTRHYHRSDYASLQRQMSGYGIGLTAYYTSLLCHDWTLVFALARLVPRALRDTFGRQGAGLASVSEAFPPDLLRLKTKGMLAGPLAYLRSRRSARRPGAGVR